MSDLEQVDVISTEDDVKSSNSLRCACCDCQKDGLLIFYCDKCSRWIHASCLHSGPPSSILADNYFHFKCISCSDDGKETFERMKLTWVQVVCVALYNLAQTSLGKQGYFKWKEDICVFIDSHWEAFFGDSKKRTPQWSCTIGSVLSAGNPHRFQSGYGIFKDSGWWRLVDPTKAPEYSPTAPIVSTPRARSRRSYFTGTSSRSSSRKRSRPSPLLVQSASKTKKLLSKENSADDNGSVDSPLSSNFTDVTSLPASPSSSHSSSIDLRAVIKQEAKIDPVLPLAALSDDSDTEAILADCVKPESLGLGTFTGADDDAELSKRDGKLATWTKMTTQEAPSRDEQPASRNSAEQKPDETLVPQRVKPMSLYEERRLLKKLLAFANEDCNVAVRRLRRKLLVRQKKRELGVEIFSFDSMARKLAAKEMGLMLPPEDSQLFARPAMSVVTSSSTYLQHHRILDRFLSPSLDLNRLDVAGRTFRQKLVGRDENDQIDQQLIVSPYTQRLLKPYIRRDFETKPPKLRLLEELVSHVNRKDPTWTPSPAAPIDFCYVRPQHIPTINAMCSHFFWPGIDLSESLQYPDFSVVALYKKMVIGFGFLVPDVSFNEAYISFLSVHPDWQLAGVGTFMLYHLIQTFMGKDVTLHVSASNPAMLLYQKFGFKPERFDADFYDKYLSTDSTDCAHAFFMRLRR